MVIGMTLNGRPPKEHQSKDPLEGALLKLAIEKIGHKVSRALTAEEAGQITMDLTGKDAGDLSIRVRGPEGIVTKVEAALAQSTPLPFPLDYR